MCELTLPASGLDEYVNTIVASIVENDYLNGADIRIDGTLRCPDVITQAQEILTSSADASVIGEKEMLT